MRAAVTAPLNGVFGPLIAIVLGFSGPAVALDAGLASCEDAKTRTSLSSVLMTMSEGRGDVCGARRHAVQGLPFAERMAAVCERTEGAYGSVQARAFRVMALRTEGRC